MIDETDRKILNIVQENARISNAELARLIGLAPSAVLERVKKLEERGVISGYRTEIKPHIVGFGLTAFVFVRTRECSKTADRLLSEIPEVLEVHDVAGDEDYLLKIRARDAEDLSRILREKLKSIPNVVSTRTTVVLQTLKEGGALPIETNEPKKEQKKRVRK